MTIYECSGGGDAALFAERNPDAAWRRFIAAYPDCKRAVVLAVTGPQIGQMWRYPEEQAMRAQLACAEGPA